MSLYRIARTAQRDLDAIWCDIGSFDVRAADRWLEGVERRFTILATPPHAGQARPDLAPELRFLPVGRVMEVLGEAVKRLPPELCQRYAAVPWTLIAGMRDRVSHGCDAIDYTTLWDTVRDAVPGLITPVEQMLKDQEEAPGK